MEETGVLTGERAYNGHFGECIALLGDIDDDGYQGNAFMQTLDVQNDVWIQ